MKIYDLRTNNNNEIVYTSGTGSTLPLNGVVNVTKAQLTTLVSTSGLSNSNHYAITDSFHGGTIVVSPVSNYKLNPNATWLRPTKLCAFGVIGITSGSSGSVDTITVSGTNIMTASVPFATSITQTATNVVANINANSATSGYRAVAITNGYFVVASTTAGASKNGYVVAGTSTGLVLGNALPLARGIDSTIQELSVIYSLSADRIYECKDSINNVVRPLSEGSVYAGDPINEFPWGDTRYFSNTIESNLFKDNFLYSNVAGFRNNTCLGNSYFASNFWSIGNISPTSFTVFYNLLFAGGNIKNNIWNCSVTSATGLIAQCALYDNSNISNNCITGSGNQTFGLFYNKLVGSNCSIASNIVTLAPGVVASMNSNSLIGSSSSIFGNTFVYAGSISNNYLNANSSTIQSNTFGASAPNTSSITLNVLNGGSSSIRSNIINSDNCKITYNVLEGNGATITTNTLAISNAIISSNTLNAASAYISGITATTDFRTISGIEWTQNEYKLNISKELTGAANLGLSGSPVKLGVVPAKWYAVEAEIEGSGLTSSGGTMKIGIETDNDSCLLAVTTATTLNSVITSGSIVKTKATAPRYIIATPETANITAGAFKVNIRGKLGI